MLYINISHNTAAVWWCSQPCGRTRHRSKPSNIRRYSWSCRAMRYAPNPMHDNERETQPETKIHLLNIKCGIFFPHFHFQTLTMRSRFSLHTRNASTISSWRSCMSSSRDRIASVSIASSGRNRLLRLLTGARWIWQKKKPKFDQYSTSTHKIQRFASKSAHSPIIQWLIDWLGTLCLHFFPFSSAKLSLVLSSLLFYTKLDYFAHK